MHGPCMEGHRKNQKMVPGLLKKVDGEKNSEPAEVLTFEREVGRTRPDGDWWGSKAVKNSLLRN